MKNCISSFSKILILICLLLPGLVFSQENNVEMADVMRSNGKIYVVVAVISVILLVLLIALIRIDRKVRNLEKNSKG